MGYLAVSAIFVLIAAVTAEVERAGTCPPASGMVGICMFNPKVNCLKDSECAEGYKCCSEGCNRVCKKIVSLAHVKVSTKGECPAPSGMVGICIFIPGVNCVNDNECPSDKRCCSEGCGKICKTAV